MRLALAFVIQRVLDITLYYNSVLFHKISDYAIDHEGLVRDAWDLILQKPCHHLRDTNDILDVARDNMALYIHPNRPKQLLMVLTRDVQADKKGLIPYGGYLFSDFKYFLDVLIKAVCRYDNNVRR